jgi:hypothetical protein
MRHFINYILPCILFTLNISVFSAQRGGSDTLNIFIIAGQSNAINIHTYAADLPAGTVDTTIKLYYHCGVPPDRNLPEPYFATSRNKWVGMNFQIQNPYVGSSDSFFGPEITMANKFKAQYGNIAIIKCAYGGSDLASDWKPDAATGNKMFSVMKSQVNNALHILDSLGIPYKIKAFFWIQGEADAASNAYSLAYLNNLKSFIQAIRQEFNNPDLPFLISRLPSFQRTTYLSRVREAQVRVCDSVSNTYWLNTDDLINCGDYTHFNSASVLKLGIRLAELFINNCINNVFNTENKITGFSLSQNYPNPFNPNTTISYQLSKSGQVTIKVYDVLGNEVKTLVNEYKTAGSFSVNFDSGKLSSGMYIYRITTDGFTSAKKMLLLK